MPVFILLIIEKILLFHSIVINSSIILIYIIYVLIQQLY
uniref:Uncharacterized protein n=1 Tax=Chondria sp. (in: red algae) TaxID=1982705 RepID=A0A1Z1MED3_9FLOR|nr:hypothetical protein [Chondria sp. (in: red algae)]